MFWELNKAYFLLNYFTFWYFDLLLIQVDTNDIYLKSNIFYW
jgi:hypothetical protein